MNIVIGIIGGLIWGSAAACLNRYIMKKAVESNKPTAITKMSAARTAIDVICLAAVFLVRKVSAASFTAALVSSAAALSMLTIFFTYQIAGGKATANKKETEKE